MKVNFWSEFTKTETKVSSSWGEMKFILRIRQ